MNMSISMCKTIKFKFLQMLVVATIVQQPVRIAHKGTEHLGVMAIVHGTALLQHVKVYKNGVTVYRYPNRSVVKLVKNTDWF